MRGELPASHRWGDGEELGNCVEGPVSGLCATVRSRSHPKPSVYYLRGFMLE